MNKFFMTGIIALMASGCASKTDLHAIQGQVDALHVNITSVRDTINDAHNKIDSANYANKRAEFAFNDINEKLDRIFHKGATK